MRSEVEITAEIDARRRVEKVVHDEVGTANERGRWEGRKEGIEERKEGRN